MFLYNRYKDILLSLLQPVCIFYIYQHHFTLHGFSLHEIIFFVFREGYISTDCSSDATFVLNYLLNLQHCLI
ncbi:Ovule protein [Paenibacillus lactis]|uniref:Uncharacterized protein n=2 Tax=Paenibacillus lactis TaxID=228574 RepID=G4HEF0_9BACL|nr:hypothetical protein PaelaDRAFT_2361 [Paenibacillus lactis 154]MBP1896035.1 hypothetical protein [Paenibacillus lactis]